jgi:hypothetical protein
MKKLLLMAALVAAFSVETVSSQTGIYIGYENGLKWDKFNYINSKGFSANHTSFNSLYGGYVGFKLNRYTIETGFYYHYLSINTYQYDRATGAIGLWNGRSHGSGEDSWVIPLRFGMEFNLAKKRIFIKPEIGLTGIIATNYSKSQPYGWGAENIRMDSTFIPTTGDSTITYMYRTSKFNLGYEVSLSAGVRIKKKFDIYIKGSVYNSFKPLYYETITYYSDLGNATATNMFHGNSFTLQFGLRYLFEIKKKK